VRSTQWYLLDKDRLRIELRLMERNGVNFQLCRDEYGNLLWRGPLCIRGHYHGHVRIVYPENFPFEQIRIYVFEPMLPRVNLHIHEDGSICTMKPEEWSPNWTGLAMYLKTIEFLDSFYSGKMRNEVVLTPADVGTYRSRGLLSVLREVFTP